MGFGRFGLTRGKTLQRRLSRFNDTYATWLMFFMAKRIEKEKAAPLRGAAFIVNK